MADPRGFLKVRERELPAYRPVPVRLMDWREVHEHRAEDSAIVKVQAGRCMYCGVAFCQTNSNSSHNASSNALDCTRSTASFGRSLTSVMSAMRRSMLIILNGKSG